MIHGELDRGQHCPGKLRQRFVSAVDIVLQVVVDRCSLGVVGQSAEDAEKKFVGDLLIRQAHQRFGQISRLRFQQTQHFGIVQQEQRLLDRRRVVDGWFFRFTREGRDEAGLKFFEFATRLLAVFRSKAVEIPGGLKGAPEKLFGGQASLVTHLVGFSRRRFGLSAQPTAALPGFAQDEFTNQPLHVEVVRRELVSE